MILMIRLIQTMINIIITGATNTTRSWQYTNFVATVLEPIATAKNKNTDTTALISHWIKLTKNFCKFYMVAKKVNCSRNPFEKFQTRLN